MYNPRQKYLTHLDRIARKYVDKVVWGQYLMEALEQATPFPPRPSNVVNNQ